MRREEETGLGLPAGRQGGEGGAQGGSASLGGGGGEGRRVQQWLLSLLHPALHTFCKCFNTPWLSSTAVLMAKPR